MEPEILDVVVGEGPIRARIRGRDQPVHVPVVIEHRQLGAHRPPQQRALDLDLYRIRSLAGMLGNDPQDKLRGTAEPVTRRLRQALLDPRIHHRPPCQSCRSSASHPPAPTYQPGSWSQDRPS